MLALTLVSIVSYVHVFMTDGDRLYIYIGGSYDVFVASWGDDLGGDLVPNAYRCRV